MKKRSSKILFFFLASVCCLSFTSLFSQVPLATTDVMLQGFYWNSHSQTKWSQLNVRAAEISDSFDMIWLPPSAAGEGGGSSNMGYHPYQWSNQTSSWGTKDELKTLINSFHEGGCKVIADVVINHRSGTSWVTFPIDNYGTGYTSYQFTAEHICKDDEANSNGYTTTGNYDYNWNVPGDFWGGYAAARDLDHSSTYVRSAIKEYMRFLKNEIGYDGWRYDLVKGYHPQYTKEYNAAAGAYFSVGEYYHGEYDPLKGWVDDTGKSSTVFDFAFKSAIYNWNGGNNYASLAWTDQTTGKLRPAGLVHSPEMRQYAVTFIDNHDTATPHENPWEYSGHVAQANAIMLAAPGIPCVFWKHWSSHKSDIQKMIAARKAVGLHSNSDVEVTNTAGYYESKGIGKCGELICRVGNWTGTPGGYELACSGTGWAYYIKLDEHATCDETEPTEEAPIGTATIRFKAPAGWTGVSVWAFNQNNHSEDYTGGAWPGVPMAYNAQGGYYEIVLTSVNASLLGIVFNDGNSSGGEQTVDLFTTGSMCWKADTNPFTENGVVKYNATEEASCTSVTILPDISGEGFCKVYPNPVKDVLYIDTENEITGVEINAVSGEVVKIANGKNISVQDFSPGMYILKIYFNNGRYIVRKMIKE